MEIGTKPILISVLTAVTNSALNAASVFPSRRIVISHTDLNRSADIPIFRLWTRLCKILQSHGAVLIEQYRQAASYVDRITVGAHQRARPKPYTNYRADAAYNDHQS